MRIIEWERDDPLTFPHGVSMTIGVFDALHLGHRELIHRILEREFGAESLVITFRDNPLKVLQPGGYPGNVLTLDQKLERIAALGVRTVLLIDFSLDFSRMSGTEFILRINALLRPHLLVLGRNFRCGHRNDTNAEKVRSLLGSQGVRVDIVEPVLDNGIPVSSTRIRAAIQAGDLGTARRLLGSDYFLELGGAAIQTNHQVCLVDAGDLTQVLPTTGTFDVTMYQGLPSFKGEYRREVSAGRVHPAPIRTRVTIDRGSLRWPKEIGSGYSHVRFDGTTG